MNEQMKKILGLLVGVLVVFLIVYLGVEIRNNARTSIDLSKTASITMTAEGKVSSRPDVARVSFSVVTEGSNAETVQKNNDAKMEKVISFLKGEGIVDENIKTSNYNLYPRYNYNVPEGDAPRIVGYTVNQQVTVKIVDLEKVSAIVGSLTTQGVNQIENVSFQIDDPDALREQARDEAVAKAKEKADALAKSLGVKLGRVINFNESGSTPSPYYYERDAIGLGGGGGASPVEPGSQDITVSVTVTYELR